LNTYLQMNKDITDIYDSLEDTYLDLAKTYLSVREDTLTESLLKHPSVFAFFGAVQSYAKQRKEQLEMSLEIGEAKHMELRRAELFSQGTKATQGALNAYVVTVPELMEIKTKLKEAEYRYALSRNVVSSLDHQKDMLIQLSANKRAEVRLHEL